jgi:hypothetical protein
MRCPAFKGFKVGDGFPDMGLPCMITSGVVFIVAGALHTYEKFNSVSGVTVVEQD